MTFSDIFFFWLQKTTQKGTGKWTAISALDFGVPVTLIGESVFARCLSSLKNERLAASEILSGPSTTMEFDVGGDKKSFIDDIRKVCRCYCCHFYSWK